MIANETTMNVYRIGNRTAIFCVWNDFKLYLSI